MKAEYRFILASSGTGVALDQVTAVVKNCYGVIKEGHSVVGDSDAIGRYYYVEVDTEDPVKFPGTSFIVEWSGIFRGVEIPVYTGTYTFRPVAPVCGDKTLLTWPAEDATLFYEIRYKDQGDAEVIVGRSEYPTYLDLTTYADEFTARRIKYCIYAAKAVSQTINDDGSDYTFNRCATIESSSPNRIRENGNMCLVCGRLTQIDRFTTNRACGLVDGVVVAILEKDLPQTPYLRSRINVPVDMYGRFGIYLPYRALVIFYIDAMRWNGRFLVPSKSQVDLFTTNYQAVEI